MLYCVFSIGQILNACRFSFFTLDDYWNTVWALEGQGGTQNSLWAHFADSLSFTRQMFLGWQGTWLAAFFQAFLNPLLLLKVGPGQERLLHLILASVVLLFFLSIFLVLYEIIRLLYGKSLALSMIIYAILLFSLLNFGVYKENFYWFTGVGGYSVPFCCGMFGIYVLLLPAGRNYAGGRRGAGRITTGDRHYLWGIDDADCYGSQRKTISFPGSFLFFNRSYRSSAQYSCAWKLCQSKGHLSIRIEFARSGQEYFVQQSV